MKLIRSLGLSTTLIFCLTLTSMHTFGQTVHGPTAKYAYSSLEKHSIGLGYHFMKYKDDWGWVRPSHNYYIEYIPEFKAIGASANIQYTVIAFKAGFEAGFRSKNENNNAYFNFFPHIGFDLINIDLSFGPDFVTTPIAGESVGWRAHLKIHPKLFNNGSRRLQLHKRKKN